MEQNPKIKVYIFPNNSEWGAYYDPDRGKLVYKNAINFENDAKRDEFVNEYLNDGNDYKQSLETDTTVTSFTYVNDEQVSFKCPYDKKLFQSDFAVVKYDGDDRYYFYILTVALRKAGEIEFNATLDIFFTHPVGKGMFRDGMNFVERAHRKRFKDDGTVDWNVVRKNDDDILPMKNTLAHTVGSKVNFRQAPGQGAFSTRQQKVLQSVKWVMVYVLESGRKSFWKQILDNDNQAIGYTSFHNTPLPFLIYMLPIISDRPETTKVYLGASDGSFDTNTVKVETHETLTRILHANNKTFFKTVILRDVGFENKIQYRFSADGKDLFVSNPATSAGTPRAIDTVANFDKQNKARRVFLIRDLEALKPRSELVDIPLSHNDPAFYNSGVYKVVLKSWDAEGYNYYLPYLKQETGSNNQKISIKVKWMNLMSPTDNNAVYWIESDRIGKSIPNGRYLLTSLNDNLPTSDDPYNTFLRDNINTFNTKKTYDRISAVSQVVTSIIALGLTVGSKGATAPLLVKAGAGLTITNAIVSGIRQESMRNAQIADLKNQPGSINVTDSFIPNQLIANSGNSPRVQLLVYTLQDHEVEQFSDKLKTYGYAVGENVKLKDLINTREGYFYIRATDVFSNIKLKVSARIKQRISEAFADGLTVWRYTTKDKWKGILAYDQPNDEV